MATITVKQVQDLIWKKDVESARQVKVINALNAEVRQLQVQIQDRQQKVQAANQRYMEIQAETEALSSLLPDGE